MPPLLGCFWPGSKRSREKGRDNEHSSKRSGAARSDKAAHAAAGSSHHSGGMAEAAAASALVVKEGRQGGHPWKQLASDRTSTSLCDTAIGTHQGTHPDTPNSSCVSGTEFARLENARLKAENARLKEILAASVAHPRAHSLDSRPPFSILAPHGSTAAEASSQDPLTPVPSAQQPQRVSAGELRTPKAAAAAAAAEAGGRRSTDSLPSSGMDAAAGVAADSQCEQQQHPQQPAWLQRQIVGSALSTVSEAAHHQHQQQQQLQQLYHNQQQGSCGSGAPSPHCESAQGHTCEPSPSMNLVTLEALQGNAQAHAVPMALLLLAGSVEEYEEDTVQQPPSPIAEESRSPTSSQIDLTPQRSMPSSLPFSEALPDVNVYEMASCVWLNDAFMHCMEAHTKQAAISATNRTINSNLTFQRHMVGFCKNLALGKQGPICFWSVFFPTAGPAQVDRICMWPCELLDTDGACTGHPGGVFRAIMVSTETGLSMDAQRNVLLQQHMAYQFAPCMVTVLDTEGCILTQNAESVACLGCHSKEHQVCTAPDSPSTMDASQHRHKTGLPQQQQPLSYLKELFYDQEDLLVEMQEALEGQEPYIDRMEIRSPLLRTWLGASEGQEIWHRVHVIRLTDPISRQQQYCLSQVDVTATIEAERHVLQLQQQQSALLREILPQQVIEHLLMHKSAMVAGAWVRVHDARLDHS